jgi:Right handed beta helix region
MRRIALFTLLAGFLVPALMSTPAHAQATRTWVSGVGDDNNTSFGCSRTATCKTFAAAISVTDTNGEINCIDPGGFGTLTITKSITIDCGGTFGGIVAAGANGITINLTATPDPLKSVVLRGLNINGAGNAGQAGLRGVSILSATLVTLDNVVISNFTQQGVADVRTVPGKLFIKNSVIRNNAGVGIVVAATGGTNMASIENTHTINNLYGLAVASGNQIKVTRSVLSGNSTAGIVADPGGQVGVEHSTVNFNGTALQAFGTIWIDDTDVAFNQAATAGTPVSFGNNRFYANVTPPAGFTGGAPSTDRGQN